MDRNIKIAKQLVKIARELVATNEINADSGDKMSSGVIFDLDSEPIEDARSASRKRQAFLESLWNGDDDLTMMERLGVMVRSIFKSKKTLEEEKRMQETVDETNAKIQANVENVKGEMQRYTDTFEDSKFYVLFSSKERYAQFVIFRREDCARLMVRVLPGSASVDLRERKIVVDSVNETPFHVMIDIPSPRKAKPFQRGGVDQSIYTGGTNMKAMFKSFEQLEKYANDHFKNEG